MGRLTVTSAIVAAALVVGAISVPGAATAAPASAAAAAAASTPIDIPLPEPYAASTYDTFTVTDAVLTPATTTIVVKLPTGDWQNHGISSVSWIFSGATTGQKGTAAIDPATGTVSLAITPGDLPRNASTQPVYRVVVIGSAPASSTAPAPTPDQTGWTPTPSAFSLTANALVTGSAQSGPAVVQLPLDASTGTEENTVRYWIPSGLTAAPGASFRFAGAAGQLPGTAWGSYFTGPRGANVNADIPVSVDTDPDDSRRIATIGAHADFSPYFWPAVTQAYFHLFGYPTTYGQIYIDGPATVQQPDPLLPTTSRVAGDDRFETAVALSRSTFPSTAKVVYIVSGYGFADALSAAPAARSDGGPLLLTGPTWLPTSVAAEIRRLQPSRVMIVGGTDVVSPGVERSLRAIVPDVERLAGSDRYETSRQVLSYAFSANPGSIYVATGRDFPDALSAAATAGLQGEGLLLVDGQASEPDPATVDAVRRFGQGSVTLVGGVNAISGPFQTALRWAVPSVVRVAGADRYDTSYQLASGTFQYRTAKHAYLATGLQYPDALAAAVSAGSSLSPMLLVPQQCLPVPDRDLIHQVAAQDVTVVGGENALGAPLMSLTTC